MALRAIMLRRNIEKKKEELKQLREKDAEFQKRETELTTAIEEAETEEQQTVVQEEVESFDAEKEEHEKTKTDLEEEIAELERQLSSEESKNPEKRGVGKDNRSMEGINVAAVNIRSLPGNQRAFEALPMETRQSMIRREDVKEFLSRVREMKGQQRAVKGGELTIPIVFLDLIAENMYRYSKLLNRVRVRPLNGEARQTIAGTVPEAVWTEMCGAINELSFQFNQVTADGYKVAGFIPVCNSLLEDNDVNLASWIVEMISEAIGLAMDKAILYGKGAASKMPLGIVTRLAQKTKPSDYPADAPEWVNLSASNIQKIDSSTDAVTFWSSLTLAAGNTFTKYSRGQQSWAMNSRTYAKLKSKLIAFASTGALTAQLGGTMPVIDGDIDILEFMPDGDIVGGYGDLYLLVQRSEMTIEESRHVQFIQDNTVFKGSQRADGQPVVPGAFVAININNIDVTTVMDFAADKANDAKLNSLKIGSETLTPDFDSNVYEYTMAASAASDKIEFTKSQTGTSVSATYDGTNFRNGGTVEWIADGEVHPLVLTTKQGNAVRVYKVNVTKAKASD